MRDLIIIGGGGFGREVAALVNDINKQQKQWNFLGFIDDLGKGTTPEGYPIIGTVEELLKYDQKPLVAIAIASAEVRERLSVLLRNKGFEFATLIHPSVEIGPAVSIGDGCIICKKTQFTTNIQVGNFCILNENCAVGHDTCFDDFVSIMSFGLFGGESHIGKGCYFGLRCTAINRLSIAENCTFGAGCVIAKDIAESGTYVGVPAKLIKKRKDA